ncbi:uncharacterized protein LOC115349349 isoform X3 [Aquila chrysaetos chrysaetos]|uniref:uncharacterized protein LOC115349349 isoform X3 n=1 Tax=Aquila chrysaetos chrysaetos TaxID=223781 RepID=UPI0011766DFF|nr:uncharacterized protein LOC115349349 isoform X3 [Aquila chrysaetos chrysaetos]
MAGVAGKGIANVKIGDKGRLEETPREQGCAGGMMRSRASLVSGVQGTGQLCGSFLQNTCPFLLGERRVDGAACPLEEGEAGGAPVAVWKQSAPCAGAQTPVVAHSPPHAGACPPVPVHVPRTGASLQHARGGTEEQHSRQQELSIAERRRATRPYRGRGKTAASVMPSCGPPLYFQTPRLRLGVFLVCSTGPGSSSPAEQQPVPWMGSPLPRSGSGTFGCSSSLRGHRALPWEQLSPASGSPCWLRKTSCILSIPVSFAFPSRRAASSAGDVWAATKNSASKKKMLFQLLREESRSVVDRVLVQEERGQTSSGGRVRTCHTRWQRIFAFSK